MIANVDWNREGLAAGSSTLDDDWKDWKRPVISLDNAKLFLNNTWANMSIQNAAMRSAEQLAKLETAQLNSTSRVSSCAERSME